MIDDDDPDWAPVLDAHSTRADLERVIAEQTEAGLAELRGRLAADPDLTDYDRRVALAFIEPWMRRQNREAFEAAFQRLRPH